MLSRILLTAEPFAFGPAAKMAILAHELRAVGQVHVLVRDSAEEIATLNDLPVTRYGNRSAVAPLAALVDEYDLVINVMNFELSEVLRRSQTPAVYVDTLMWLAENRPWRKARPARYFCQNFPGTAEKIERTEAPFECGFELVGPILAPSPCTPRSQEHVLIALGGVGRDGFVPGRTTQYPGPLLLPLLEEIRASTTLPIIVTAGRDAAQVIGDQVAGIPEVRACSLPHPQFLAALRRSAYLLVNPGIESLYEAFETGVPTFILPSTSPSHLFQRARLRAHGLTLPGLEWPALDEEGSIERVRRGPKSFMAMMTDEVERGLVDARLRPTLERELGAFIAGLPQTDRVSEQTDFITAMGGHGRRTIIDAVTALLR